MQQKKISVWSAAAIVILAVVLSSMTTVIALRTSYRVQLDEITAEYSKQFDEVKSTYDAKLAAIDEQMKEYGEIAADISEIDRMYREMYPGELNTESLREYAIKGFVVGTGDRYGIYYSPDEAEALMADVNGESEGIGVNVIYDADTGSIEIIDVSENSPADKAGVLTGDRIAYVIDEDGKELAVAEIGYDMALAKLRGAAGTKAKFVAYRDTDGDGSYDEHEFEIERAAIESMTVSYRLYEPDNTIGVIRISGFDKKTPEQFKAAVESLKTSGAAKLIFDVRYNPGGDKDAVCEVLDYLLPEGPLLRTVDAQGNYTVDMSSDASFLDMPMAVVVNGGTASAGELFAAAIRDYGAGKLVGEQTYGKGSMQSIIPIFDDGSLLKMTVTLYCPPKTENYDGVGLKPDKEVEIDQSLKDKNFYKYTDSEDNQLRAAAATFE